MLKQNIEKVLDKDASLAERIRTFFRVQGITLISVLTALSMTITTFVLAITGVFGGGGGGGGGGGEGSASPPKAERTLKEWLNRLADAIKRLAGKDIEALLAIFRSVVGAILCFLGKAVGFVAEHTWAKCFCCRTY